MRVFEIIRDHIRGVLYRHFRGWLKDVVFQMEGGLRQGMGYTGSKTILDLKDRVQFQKITSSGVKESHVHNVSITKEAPNYRAD